MSLIDLRRLSEISRNSNILFPAVYLMVVAVPWLTSGASSRLEVQLGLLMLIHPGPDGSLVAVSNATELQHIGLEC
jgi:hypothetical protein